MLCWILLSVAGALPVVEKQVVISPHGEGQRQGQWRADAPARQLLRREGSLEDEAQLVDREAIGSHHFACSTVFIKCRNIITAYKAHRASRLQRQGLTGTDLVDAAVEAPDGWLYKLEQAMETQATGEDEMNAFYKVLNDMDLGAALRAGVDDSSCRSFLQVQWL